MINLKELADLCGVSIATISNTLNGKSNVSEATKKRIMEKIRETGYQPNSMARKLRSANCRRYYCFWNSRAHQRYNDLS